MADTVILKVGKKLGVNFFAVIITYFPVYSRRLSSHAQMVERGKPEWLLWQQRKASRKTSYSYAGIGGSKKQMPFCNGTDTNVNRLTRKRAHFELVQNGEIIWRTE
jgi:hypothetical protein